MTRAALFLILTAARASTASPASPPPQPQDPAVEQLLRAAASFRAIPSEQAVLWRVHDALLDWLEPRLPTSIRQLDASFSDLGEDLRSQLRSLGLFDTDTRGHIGRLELSRPDASTLAIIAGVDVGCGNQDVLYAFHYPNNGKEPSRRLFLQSEGPREKQYWIWNTAWSAPDPVTGARSALILRCSVQCASNWVFIDIEFYQWNPAFISAPARLAFHGEHSLYHDFPTIRITPESLRLDFRDASIDSNVHNRAHILHFRVPPDGAPVRVDPVALNVRDFVDEWLNRPWSEMATETAPIESLANWHSKLAGKSRFGTFKFVQPCGPEWPGHSEIGLELPASGTEAGGAPGVDCYFLARERSARKYEMVSIGTGQRHPGCPGEGAPHLAHQN